MASLIPDGWLLDVIGRPARSEHFTFVPVLAEFAVGPRRHFLKTAAGDDPPPALAVAIRGAAPWLCFDQCDGLWTRARIGRIFGFTPLAPDLADRGVCLLDVPFLAIPHAQTTSRWDLAELNVTPFVCTDGAAYVGDRSNTSDTGLAFPAWVDLGRGERIAEDFWRLLLAEPDALATFSDHCVGVDAEWSVYRVGCDGRLFMVPECGPVGGTFGLMEDDEFEEYCLEEIQVGYQSGMGPWDDCDCDDCGGTGFEYIRYPVGQTCEACMGSGRVTWYIEYPRTRHYAR